MSSPRAQPPAPLVGRGGCLALAIAFLLFGLFRLGTAQLVDHGGLFGSLARVLPVVAVATAVIAMSALERLSVAYRALGISAGCLVAWLIVTWLASLGA